MKNHLLLAPLLMVLALILSQQLGSQTSTEHEAPDVSGLRADASETDQAATLQTVTDWLRHDFASAQGLVVRWVQDEAISAEQRSRILSAAFEAARQPPNPEFDAIAETLYQALADELPPGPLRSRLRQSYGNLTITRGRFEQAESLYLLAVAEGEARPVSDQANMKSSLGVALAQQGRFDDALSEMLNSYRLYEQAEGGPSTALLRNIGGLAIYLEDWDRAVTFAELAIEQIGPDDPSAAGAYSNLAVALIEQGDLETALETLLSAKALGDSHGQQSSSVFGNIGFVLRELGRPEEALEYFHQTLELSRQEGNEGAQAVAQKNIGETLIALNRRQQADTFLQLALETYRAADIKPKRLELYPVLVENLEQLRQYPQALAMMREYRALTEELSSADAQMRVAELQTAFDLERKERELAESERERLAREAELAALQAEQSRQQLVRAMLVAGVVILGLFLLVLLRFLYTRTLANRLLAEKNAEIDLQRSALSESNRRLHRYSIEDELTGLGNRRSLRELLRSELPESFRQKPALLILIDLDRFKAVNDRFGHVAGDDVLSHFAKVLEVVAGPNDLIVRWGGEEFLWLIADADAGDAAERCGELAKQVDEAAFEIAGRRISITSSMGVAPVELGSDDPQVAFDLALKIADAALYQAKDNGRNQWVGFQPRTDDLKLLKGSLDIEALVVRGALVRI